MELIDYSGYFVNEDIFDNNISHSNYLENTLNKNRFDIHFPPEQHHVENIKDDNFEKNEEGEQECFDNLLDGCNEVDLFAQVNEEIDINNITESLTLERSCHASNSKDQIDSKYSSKEDSNTIMLKLKNIDENCLNEKDESFGIEKIINNQRVFESREAKLTKINDSFISNESINQIQSLDEGSLIFLIRKVDKKTNKSILLTKHRKKITKCSHIDLEYYAKGMCKNCYHNKGTKSKKAYKCEHLDRDHYAKGLCKNCYLHFFHIKKKQTNDNENPCLNNQE